MEMTNMQMGKIAKGLDKLVEMCNAAQEEELKAARKCTRKNQEDAKIKHGIAAFHYRLIREFIEHD